MVPSVLIILPPSRSASAHDCNHLVDAPEIEAGRSRLHAIQSSTSKTIGETGHKMYRAAFGVEAQNGLNGGRHNGRRETA